MAASCSFLSIGCPSRGVDAGVPETVGRAPPPPSPSVLLVACPIGGACMGCIDVHARVAACAASQDKPLFWRRKAPVLKCHLLLMAHLDREQDIPEKLQPDLKFVLGKAPVLLEEMLK
eukprot:125293-Chlamydomonas_euryale.AAC.1